MTLYEQTVDALGVQAAEETLRLAREEETRKIAEAAILITRVGEMIAAGESTLAALRGTLTYTGEGLATITIDAEMTFTLVAHQQCEVTMLTAICTAGCHGILATREQFLEFVATHIALGHTPEP
jgi:hypothetical protein